MTLPLAELRKHLPGLVGERVVAIGDGWDSEVHVVDGAWVVRVPRRPQVAVEVRAEIALLAELAPTLPVAVPRAEAVGPPDEGWFAYRLIDGVPMRPGAPADEVAAFLTEFLSDPANFAFRPAVVHADLGPEHLLCGPDGRLVGVIGWTDAHVGDPALDFAWLLTGLVAGFASELLAAYDGEVDDTFRARAAFFHLLGPWYEALYGVDFGLPNYVASGLAGVRERLA